MIVLHLFVLDIYISPGRASIARWKLLGLRQRVLSCSHSQVRYPSGKLRFGGETDLEGFPIPLGPNSDGALFSCRHCTRAHVLRLLRTV